MTRFRITLIVLATLHLLLAGFAAVVGAFADGGTVWERLVVSALHPLAALALLALFLLPRITKPATSGFVVLLAANVLADVTVALLIALGNLQGDWWLPLIFSVVPAIGIVYGLAVLRRLARES
jgi:hypothetical protein